MAALIEQNLQACNKQSASLSNAEISLLLHQLNDWEIENNNGVNSLIKAFSFKNFNSALVYANEIGKLAELENHHPCICIEWGQVTIRWWTHTISGLFINDFIMAAKCDAEYGAQLKKL